MLHTCTRCRCTAYCVPIVTVHACMPYLRTCARRIPHERKSCSPHPLIVVDRLLAPPTYFLLAYARMRSVDSYISTCYIVIIMAGLNARGLQNKLLITTPLKHLITTPLILKYVKTTLGLLFSWLHILHCTVVISLGNLTSIPSYSCLVYAVLLLISLLLYIYTCFNQCNLCWKEAL